jgi:hypothetical protein
MEISRVTPTGWAQEDGTHSLITPSGWVDSQNPAGFLGTNLIQNVFLGTTKATGFYLGSTKIWSPEV